MCTGVAYARVDGERQDGELAQLGLLRLVESRQRVLAVCVTLAAESQWHVLSLKWAARGDAPR